VKILARVIPGFYITLSLRRGEQSGKNPIKVSGNDCRWPPTRSPVVLDVARAFQITLTKVDCF
jgi:hypothetical protein